MSPAQELFEIAGALDRIGALADEPALRDPVQARIEAANEVARAASGSWLGYHAFVYQEQLRPVPGARFDMQWGLNDRLLGDNSGSWAQYDRGDVKAAIYRMSGVASLDDVRQRVAESERDFERLQGEALSILAQDIENRSDAFLEKLSGELESIKTPNFHDVVNLYMPKGQFRSADRIAVNGGIVTPPHIEVLAESAIVALSLGAARSAANSVRQAASHIERRMRSAARDDRVGTNIFIGHGRSPLWRELKDFITERLRLPVDEFNRVPVAGITNIARLSEMLDDAAIAFIILTAEDETAEGTMRARMNAIHEVGLFQGRLGFTKAIILLEDGCEAFSNIQGLGHIAFPPGDIRAAFEELRQVIERELPQST